MSSVVAYCRAVCTYEECSWSEIFESDSLMCSAARQPINNKSAHKKDNALSATADDIITAQT